MKIKLKANETCLNKVIRSIDGKRIETHIINGHYIERHIPSADFLLRWGKRRADGFKYSYENMLFGSFNEARKFVEKLPPVIVYHWSK